MAVFAWLNSNSLTTYIDPQKYIEIFADTDLTSQNFWVQTVVQATRQEIKKTNQILLKVF